MRMFHQRRSFYPLVIAILTLALGLLMFYTLGRSAINPSGLKSLGNQGNQTSQVSPTPAVTDAEYRTNAHAVIAPFLMAYGAASNDGVRLGLVEDALAALMPITVTVSYKDVHLGLAVSLSLMRDGLRGEEGSLATGYAKLTKIAAAESWLAV